MTKTTFNGRDPINIMNHEFIPERTAAELLGVNVMRLRRSAVLHMELRGTSVSGHPYYMKSEVERIAKTLESYVIRSNMKRKPKTKSERIKAKECVVYGVVCYPRKAVVEKNPQPAKINNKKDTIKP